MPVPDVSESERRSFMVNKQKPVQLRVYNVVKHWVDKHWVDFEDDIGNAHTAHSAHSAQRTQRTQRRVERIANVL